MESIVESTEQRVSFTSLSPLQLHYSGFESVVAFFDDATKRIRHELRTEANPERWQGVFFGFAKHHSNIREPRMTVFLAHVHRTTQHNHAIRVRMRGDRFAKKGSHKLHLGRRLRNPVFDSSHVTAHVRLDDQDLWPRRRSAHLFLSAY